LGYKIIILVKMEATCSSTIYQLTFTRLHSVISQKITIPSALFILAHCNIQSYWSGIKNKGMGFESVPNYSYSSTILERFPSWEWMKFTYVKTSLNFTVKWNVCIRNL
jgi:hypothetical protein